MKNCRGALSFRGVIGKIGLVLAFFTAAWLCAASAAAGDGNDLRRSFVSPPNSARPWVYWFWMNGNITKEGITADLDAMHQAGIGGALIMHVGAGIPPGPVRFFSGEWRGLFKFALQEADRLGLEITMNACDGWTGTGGPWIRPEEAMMKLVWTETRLRGPSEEPISLPQPETNLDVYHDVAVLAFPAPPAEAAATAATPTVTASDPKCNGAKLIDGNLETVAALNPTQGWPWIQFTFDEPRIVRGVRFFRASPKALPASAKIQVSDDGKAFRTVGEATFGWTTNIPSITVALEDTTARYFRIVLPATRSVFREVTLLEDARVNYWELKAGFGRRWGHGADEPYFTMLHGSTGEAADSQAPSWAESPEKFAVDPKRVESLSDRMDASGRLDWKAPDGEWIVLRIGYTPTGEMNGPASLEGTGLEPDALSPRGVEIAFDRFLSKLLADAGPLAGDTLRYCHIDSWETGEQNWTANFPQEFRKRRGYDMMPLLPVMAGGRLVGSLKRSERFLWDVRRTIADMLADYYYGGMREACHRAGVRFESEAAGAQQFLFDPITYQRQADLPMGEFWVTEGRIRPDCKAAASVANIFGKQFVGAEAFTSGWTMARWTQHPYSLKPLGDEAFTKGVNRFIFHRYAMQPWTGVQPGMTMGPWGIHFERTNTWWEPGRAWMEYLARCQSLLQQGRFIGDVLYFTGEGIPNYLGDRHELNPPLPAGYDFDACNADVLLEMVSVKDGRLVLNNGIEYRVLLLPDDRTMSPKLLARIRELVEAGAVVVGPRPKHAPGLADYPGCDHQVHATADALWGPEAEAGAAAEEAPAVDRTVGKGRVFWGPTFEEIFSRLNLVPDFAGRSAEGEPLGYIHRRNDEADWYFVANPATTPVEAPCAFRVAGRQPELWDPQTGFITRPAVYREVDGRTILPIRFEPAGSVFVVFRDVRKGDSIQAVKRDGKTILSTGADSGPGDAILDEFERANAPVQALYPEISGSPKIEVVKSSDGGITALVWESGKYELVSSDGRTIPVAVDALPDPVAVDGSWQVRFPPGGTPESVTLDRLISWTEHERPEVRYFSGTAVYAKTIHVPAELFGNNRRLYLDLGKVAVIAEAKLNEKDLGILWKPPFRVDATEALKAGENRLEIRVTNLWPNRLIGDEQFPPDCRYGPTGVGGRILEWPEWFLEGKPRPEPRRRTFSSWKHYDKDSPLLESGLLGPVTIRTVERKTSKVLD